MRRAWVVLALGGLSLTAALATGRDLYFYLTYLLLLMLALSALWSWLMLRGLQITRHMRAQHVQVGHLFEETFSLRNTIWLPKLWVAVHDYSDLPGYSGGRVIDRLAPRSERGWVARSACERRGRFRLGPLVIASGDPFGLFEFERKYPQTSIVLVYPATAPLNRFPQPVGYMPGGDALRRRSHQVTPNAAGAREYAPGDGFNRIHWPSTARKRRLIVKEFELDPMLDVWILLDMHSEVHVIRPVDEAERAMKRRRSLWSRLNAVELDPSTEEYAVTAAASVAEHLIRNDRAVGLVAHGQHREVIQADRGERQLGKILETLAVLKAEGEMPFGEVVELEGRRLLRGTTVVAISPSSGKQWVDAALLLERNGIRVVNILIDAASFGGAQSSLRLHKRLRATGAPTAVLRCGDSLSTVLSILSDASSRSTWTPRQLGYGA